MNWEAIGAIAEILASVAVLLTLVYISIRVRDAKRVNEYAIHEARTTNIAARIVDNPHLAELMVKISTKTGGHAAIELAKTEWGLDAKEAEVWFRYMGTILKP
jgi:hypothetical protein